MLLPKIFCLIGLVNKLLLKCWTNISLKTDASSQLDFYFALFFARTISGFSAGTIPIFKLCETARELCSLFVYESSIGLLNHLKAWRRGEQLHLLSLSLLDLLQRFN